MILRYITLLALFFLLPCSVWGESTSYYVANNPGPGGEWGNGSDANNGLAKTTPFLTIRKALTTMKGGDELIIADGRYTGADNIIDVSNSKQPPEGSASAYTTIKAENEGQVILDGEGARRVIYIAGDETVDGSSGLGYPCNYIEIRGLISANSSTTGIYVRNAKYIKIINCGIVDPGDGNQSGLNLAYSSYGLVEGCYAWGAGRYKFATYHSDHIVFRNLVARMDRANPNDPVGEYSAYQSTNVEIQNCIAIDGDQPDYVINVTNYAGSFNVPMTYPDTSNDGPVHFTNCIGLNVVNRFGGYAWNANKPSDAYVTNSVGWDYTTPDAKDFIHSQGSSVIENCTFGEVNTKENNDVTYAWYNGWKDGNNTTSENNIWFNFKNGGLFYDLESSNYNNIYGLDDGYSIDVNGKASTNTISYNPKDNGLKYITRIEPGSALALAGENGTYIGANIIYQYGKSGTMWGEYGYNKLQDGTDGQEIIKLWPFPNEDIIKEKMAAYSYDGGKLTGKRGFCADGKQLNGIDNITLTSYIWEYLGNQMPDDIYSGVRGSYEDTPPVPPVVRTIIENK